MVRPSHEPAIGSLSALPVPPLARLHVGTLTIQVVGDPTFVRWGEARILRGDHRVFPREPSVGGPEIRTASPDEKGVFRFDDLTPGLYRAAVFLPDLVLEHSVTIPEMGSKSLLWRLGQTTVEGRVRDGDGAPLIGARITLERKPADVRDCQRFAETDERGEYRLERVAEGEYWVVVHPGGDMYALGPRRVCQIPATGLVRLDFGLLPGEAVRWTGIARNESGDPLKGPGQIHVQDSVSGFHVEDMASDGSFVLQVPSGPVLVSLQPAGFRMDEAVSLGAIDVPEGASWNHDLVLPGTRLLVHVVLPSGWDGTPSFGVRSRGENAGHALTRQSTHFWVRDGLAPGEYVLSSHPLPFAGGLGEFPITIPPGILQLPIEIELSLF